MSQTASSIVIIDYGSGNLRSAEKAFQRFAKSRKISVSGDPQAVLAADHIVLPGVGAFGDCAQGVGAIGGMREALEQRVIKDGRPFLGICVGMQLMCARGLERGTHHGFGWFDATVDQVSAPGLKVPHMGWNMISLCQPHAVLDPLEGEDVYFVHSYAARCDDDKAQATIAATTQYGGPVTAAMARDNLLGVQFHPEKSQAAGLGLIERFLEWRP